MVEAVGDRRDLIVVGQSFGGFTAPLVADRLPVDVLAFVAGMVPYPGEPPGDWWPAAISSGTMSRRSATWMGAVLRTRGSPDASGLGVARWSMAGSTTVLFDLAGAGGEWIDDRVRLARSGLDALPLAPVLHHTHFSAANVRVREGSVRVDEMQGLTNVAGQPARTRADRREGPPPRERSLHVAGSASMKMSEGPVFEV